MISSLIAGFCLLIVSGIAKTYMSYMLFTEIPNHPEEKNT
jgi:hypothetical protein